MLTKNAIKFIACKSQHIFKNYVTIHWHPSKTPKFIMSANWQWKVWQWKWYPAIRVFLQWRASTGTTCMSTHGCL